MSIVPQDLLALARQTVDRNISNPIEGELRRAISTAYYAVFHLLIHESVYGIGIDGHLHTRTARAFQHGIMKKVCDLFSPSNPDRKTKEFTTASGIRIPVPLRKVAMAFVELYEAREEADYDGSVTLPHERAEAKVQRAEMTFQIWSLIQTHPSTTAFLQELFFANINRRQF